MEAKKGSKLQQAYRCRRNEIKHVNKGALGCIVLYNRAGKFFVTTEDLAGFIWWKEDYSSFVYQEDADGNRNAAPGYKHLPAALI